jgi:NAD(P)H-hydrate epimerase
MIPVLTAAEMRALEREAIESGRVTSLELQERAAAGAVALIPAEVPVELVAGPGNNGGDALAVARLLKQRGQHVRVWALEPEPNWKGDAGLQASRWQGQGGTVNFTERPGELAELSEAPWFVDGMFGLSVNRPLEGVAAAWAALWEARWKTCEVLALDQPSGLRPDDPGNSSGSYATRTACFGFRKLCHGLDSAREACGAISVIDLGLPAPDPAAPGSPAHWIVQAPELPRHDWSASKLTKGRVAIRAGRLGMSGAAVLGALGALRAGAGLVTVLPDAEVREEIAAQVPEAMVRAWDGRIPEGTDVLLVGPGGVDEIPEWAGPLVLDASALRAGEGPRWMGRPSTILTPHEGEFARLFELPKLRTATDRLDRLRDVFEQGRPGTRPVLLLKGHQSLTATEFPPALLSGSRAAWTDRRPRFLINDTGHWGLATGGTGDFLSGLVAGLWAQGLEPDAAAWSAAWLHGKCADRLGPGPLLPRDLAEELPRLLRDLYAGRPA